MARLLTVFANMGSPGGSAGVTPVLIGSIESLTADPLVITVGAAGVPAGATIFVLRGTNNNGNPDDLSTPPGVTDSETNTYGADVTQLSSASISGLWLYRCSNNAARGVRDNV